MGPDLQESPGELQLLMRRIYLHICYIQSDILGFFQTLGQNSSLEVDPFKARIFQQESLF